MSKRVCNKHTLSCIIIIYYCIFFLPSQVASSQPIRQCTCATNDHRLHPCLVPNQSQASHHRHMILHRL